MATCRGPQCDRRVWANGLCAPHNKQQWLGKPLKRLRHMAPMGLSDRELAQWHLDHYVDFAGPNGCWLWTANRSQKGYGVVNLVGRPHLPKSQNAHRWIYSQLVAPVPSDMELDHLCFNTACVNPNHMEVVTKQENLRRRRRAA